MRADCLGPAEPNPGIRELGPHAPASAQPQLAADAPATAESVGIGRRGGDQAAAYSIRGAIRIVIRTPIRVRFDRHAATGTRC